jgi:hypothetical protein
LRLPTLLVVEIVTPGRVRPGPPAAAHRESVPPTNRVVRS